MADWLINIVSSKSGEASFVVDGATQGQPLNAHQEDTVSWSNQTNDEHQPWQTDSNYEPFDAAPLTEAIPPGEPSDSYQCLSPDANPQHWTVYYYCNRHPDNPRERGSIELTAWPITIGQAGVKTNFTPPSSSADYTKHETITWFNHTQEAHQPWQTDSNYSPVSPGSPGSLSDVLQPGEQSAGYAVKPPAGTIYYFCYLHQDREKERGAIVVTGDG